MPKVCKLTPKQIKFIDFYLLTGNATEAYRKAGYKTKGNGARVNASKLLTNHNIKKEIRRQQKNLCKKMDIKKEDVLRRIIQIAKSNLSDYMRWGNKEVKITTQDGGKYKKTISEVVLLDSKDISDEKLWLLSELSQTPTGIKIKLHDKLKALEMLAQYTHLYDAVEDENNEGEDESPKRNIVTDFLDAYQAQDRIRSKRNN